MLQRRWANVSLLVLVALLLIALGFHHTRWAPYLLGLALAGLAGALADWYAVTALFRHPLGMKWLPHTSIISANRDRIIEAIAALVETELLSTDFLTAHIQKISVSEALMNFLDNPLSDDVGLFLSHTAAQWVQTLPDERLSTFLERYVSEKAEEFSFSDVLVRLLQWLIQSGQDRALFLFLAGHAEDAIDNVTFTEEMERRLKEMVEHYTKTGTQKFLLGLLESMGTVDYRELSQSVRTAIKRWLHSDKAFEQFEMVLVRIMRSLRDDALVRTRVEEAKMGALGQVPWPSVLGWAKSEATNLLREGRVQSGMTAAMGHLKNWLSAEPGYQAQIDSLVKGLAMRTVSRYHSLIGKLVRDNLLQMDEREWIDKLEFYIGRDLQWIRVNGAIVGALVGLLITVLTHL